MMGRGLLMCRGAIFAFVLCYGNSFVLTPRGGERAALFSSINSPNGFDNSEDLENARSHLEELIGASGRSDTSMMCAEPPCDGQDQLYGVEAGSYQLTTIGRERRIAEIQLLSALADEVDDTKSKESDALILQNLQRLFESERGRRAKNRLAQADSIFQQGPSSWNEAEERLIAIIEEYDANWVEPLHRLSVIYYLQGNFEKARHFAQVVIDKKPWHVQGLSNLVRILEAQQDADAITWAAKRLPSESQPKRRRRWARQATQHAMDTLAEQERNLQRFFGPKERLQELNLEAWQ